MKTHALYFARRLTIVAVALAFFTAGCQNSDSDLRDSRKIWRFAIEESEGSVQHDYALRFKELIEQRTKGQVEVVVYPYGTLGTSTHITEQLNLGAVEFAMASPGSLGKFIPELQVFLLHYVLPPDDRRTRQILNDPDLLAHFDELYAPKGLKLLSIFSEGEMVWTMKREVRSPEDFRGVKVRVMTSPILLATYGAYGASPTPMPYSEVYSALQLNMIDGQVNPVFAIERQKFHEVTSWLIFPKQAPFITTCAANRDFFDGLSDDRQQMVSDVIDELDAYVFKVQTSLQTERLKDIIRDKIRQQAEFHICGDLSRFRESLTPQERSELIDNNRFLTVEPPFTRDEVNAFRRASKGVRDVFVEIGGEQSADALAWLRLAQLRAGGE